MKLGLICFFRGFKHHKAVSSSLSLSLSLSLRYRWVYRSRCLRHKRSLHKSSRQLHLRMSPGLQ